MRRLAAPAIVLAFLALLTGQAASARAEAPAAGDAAFWRSRAVAFAEQVEDAELRSQLHYELTYVLARAGEVELAQNAAAAVINPQQRIYTHSVVAQKYRELNDDDAALAVLQECQRWIAELDAESRDNWLGYLVDAYAEAGFMLQANQLNSELTGPFQDGAEDIAAEMAKRGDVAGALARIAGYSPDSRASMTGYLIATLASAGMLDEALEIAQDLPSSERCDYSFSSLIKSLIKAKRVADAEPLLARITDPRKQATARGEIAAARAADEDVPEIEARVAAATTLEEQLPLYLVLVEKLIDAGRLRDAEKAIDAMVQAIEASPRPSEPDALGTGDDQGKIAAARALHAKIAVAHARRGEQDQYVRQLELASRPAIQLAPSAGIGKFFLLMSVFSAQLEVDDFVGARALLREIEDAHRDSPRQSQLNDFLVTPLAGALAEALVKSGDVAGGVAVAESIAEGRGRGSALGEVAQALIAAGHVAEAKTLTARLDAENERDLAAYREVGSTMIAADRADELQRWLDEMPSVAARAYACLGAAEPRPAS